MWKKQHQDNNFGNSSLNSYPFITAPKVNAAISSLNERANTFATHLKLIEKCITRIKREKLEYHRI